MVRVKRGFVARRKKKKIFKHNKGFRGSLKNLTRRAKEAFTHALTHAYRHRRTKKREFRRLWNIQINAALKELGTNYSTFINLAKKAKLGLNRKILAQLASADKKIFEHIVKEVSKK